MSICHVKNGGTRVSGESTVGDWSDGNCYPTVYASRVAWSGDAIVILDDDTITETNTLATPAFASTTSVTLKKRGASSSATRWMMNSATAALINNATAVVQDFTAEDLTIGRAVPMSSGASVALLTFSGPGCENITLRRCSLGNQQIDGYVGGLVGSVLTVLGTPIKSVVSIEDSFIENVEYVAAGTGPLMRLSGNGRTYNFARTDWRNIKYIASATFNASWAIHPENTNTYGFTDCTAEDISVTGVDSAVYVRSFFFTPSTAQTVIINNFTFSRVTVGTLSVPIEAQGWGFYLSGPYTINGLHSEYCTYYDAGGRDGGQVYFNGPSAVGSAQNLSAKHCRSRSGAALFSSNGAGGVYSRVLAMHNESEVGVIYSGGYGDFEVRSAIVCYNKPFEGAIALNGIGIYARNNAATRNKTIKIINCTVVGNTTNGSCAGIAIENNDATYSCTGEVINCISRNTNANDIEKKKTAAGALTVAVQNCNVANAIVADSNVGEVVGDPLFVGGANPTTAEGFKPFATSPLCGAGYPSPAKYDYEGIRFGNPSNIGAYGTCTAGRSSYSIRSTYAPR